jgi:hypothetical protein
MDVPGAYRDNGAVSVKDLRELQSVLEELASRPD